MWWPSRGIPRLFAASCATSSRFWRCPPCGAAGTRLISRRPCSRCCRACCGSIWPTSGQRTRPVAARWRRFACEEDQISAVVAASSRVSWPRERRSPTRARPSFSRTQPPGSPCARPGSGSGCQGTPAWSLPRLGVRASPRLSSDFSFRASSPRPRSPSATRLTALHHALDCEHVARADAEAANRAKGLLNEELERRVVERTRQLSLANQELRREIAERKRAEEALRASEQRFRDYAETASDWLWETGPDHSFTRVSEELTTRGIDPASRIGGTRWDFATDVEEEPEKWRLHIATLEEHQPFRGFVYRTAGTDGSVVYIATSGKPVFDADARFLGYRGVSSNVTAAIRADQAEKALHQAQAELARVTRVTTLGELAASIAHEVNQPLAAIGADANACLNWLAADRPDLDSVREALTAIVKDGDRAGAVITRIRTLLARTSVAHGPCDITTAIRDVLPLIGPEIGRHGIFLEASLAPDLPQVMGDRIQLQQVLLNLLLNAAEAMREVPPVRRRMVVRATADHRDDGPWAIVAVEDAGVGFGEAEAPRLFEAFYTTKPGGLGMGLSISRSIIDNHRGRLWATANSDHGATFQFALPGMP